MFLSFKDYLLFLDLLKLRIDFSKIDLKFGSVAGGFVKHPPGISKFGLVESLNPRDLNGKRIIKERFCCVTLKT